MFGRCRRKASDGTREDVLVGQVFLLSNCHCPEDAGAKPESSTSDRYNKGSSSPFLFGLFYLLLAFQETRDHRSGQVLEQLKQAPAVGVHVEVVVVIIVVVIVIVVIVVVDAEMKVLNGMGGYVRPLYRLLDVFYDEHDTVQ